MEMDVPAYSTEDDDAETHDHDFGPALNHAEFINSISRTTPCDAWSMASAKKRWIYIWLATAALCSLASFISSISVMSSATEASGVEGGAVATFLFNMILMLCVVPLTICIMCRDGWVIIQ